MFHDVPGVLTGVLALNILLEQRGTSWRAKMSYTASLRQNPGRTSWLVEFRHPLKFDKGGKPGRKVRKGLGDCSEEQARSLVNQLNQLLKDESLWSEDAKSTLKLGFDARVIEIFYDNLEVQPAMHREIRQQYIPFPAKDASRRVLLLGRTGAGKTTLLRQLIGSDNKSDRFPSTSTNRTTTCEIEVISTEKDFSAVVTFMSEDEVRFKVEELVSSAILEAVNGANQRKIARGFLEDRDQRFRLKYLLGDFKEENDDEEDPYAEPPIAEETPNDNDDKAQAVVNSDELQNKLKSFLDSIKKIATAIKKKIEQERKQLADMSDQEKNEALDLIQSEVEASDDFISLVSEIMEEIRSKFSFISSGELIKSPTGWVKLWKSSEKNNRNEFIEAIKYFSANAGNLWGTLVSPLVTGIRVEGPFFPKWSQDKHPIVLIDTEGLGHKASAEANLPNSMVGWFGQVDFILLVDKATDSMANSVGKALETIAATGHTQKLIIAFTHMDELKGDNFPSFQAKKDHLRNSIRNVIANQVEKQLTREVAQYVEDHLEEKTFFLGCLDSEKEEDVNKVISQLRIMFNCLTKSPLPLPDSSTGFPEYSFDNLVLAIREGTEKFRRQWQAILGLSPEPAIDPAPWQSLKALNRRYAEGWDDGFHLKPTADLRDFLSVVISQFLENPIEWNGDVNLEKKRTVVDQIKAKFTNQLIGWTEQQLRSKPRSQWSTAYRYSGQGSTFKRTQEIESIYERYTPIPSSTGNLEVQEFMDEIKKLVKDAIDEVKREIEE
jgi:GTPase Era involved in 16S rRNA processing